MAIRIDAEFQGIQVPQSYVVVTRPTISLDKTTVSYGLWYKATPEDQFFKAENRVAPYSLSGSDPFAQAYTHLKTLAEFDGCIDC